MFTLIKEKENDIWKFLPDFVKIPKVKCKPLCYAHGTVE